MLPEWRVKTCQSAGIQVHNCPLRVNFPVSFTKTQCLVRTLFSKIQSFTVDHQLCKACKLIFSAHTHTALLVVS